MCRNVRQVEGLKRETAVLSLSLWQRHAVGARRRRSTPRARTGLSPERRGAERCAAPAIDRRNTSGDRYPCDAERLAAATPTPGAGCTSSEREPDLQLQIAHRLRAGGGAEPRVPRREPRRIERAVRQRTAS